MPVPYAAQCLQCLCLCLHVRNVCACSVSSKVQVGHLTGDLRQTTTDDACKILKRRGTLGVSIGQNAIKGTSKRQKTANQNSNFRRKLKNLTSSIGINICTNLKQKAVKLRTSALVATLVNIHTRCLMRHLGDQQHLASTASVAPAASTAPAASIARLSCSGISRAVKRRRSWVTVGDASLAPDS
jgi:hypothetical protein